MIIPVGFANVLIPARLGGGTVFGAITFGVADQAPLGDPVDIANQVWSAWDAQLLGLMDDQVTWGPVHVQLAVDGGILSGDGTLSDTGGASIASPPPNVAVLVAKNTGAPGRQGRGRFFIPWACGEDSISEAGIISPGVVNDLQENCDDLLVALNGFDLPMVVLHNEEGVVPSLVTSLSVSPLVATQRRRLRR